MMTRAVDSTERTTENQSLEEVIMIMSKVFSKGNKRSIARTQSDSMILQFRSLLGAIGPSHQERSPKEQKQMFLSRSNLFGNAHVVGTWILR